MSLKIFTITTCEFREEDEVSQVTFQDNLNVFRIEHTKRPTNFIGFIANKGGENKNAIRAIYNDDKDMVGREKARLFHF